MARFVPVAQLSRHDIGVCYKDEDKKEPNGGALFCLTREHTGNIPVNIADFNNARLMGLTWLILRIEPSNWTQRVSMEKAIRLMETARQLDGADYKLISRWSVEGGIEIPDEGLPL
jgi:hypothetical protein